MPVILPIERRKVWLNPETSKDELMSFLVPYDAERMTAYPISTRVGSPKFDDPSIIEPLGSASRKPAPDGDLAVSENEARNPE